MQLGQVVDFCFAWNDRQEEINRQQKKAEKQKEKGRRKATQADINAFFG